MSGLSEFLAMGGYAGFVWPAYLLVAAVMVGVFVESRRGLKAAEDALAALEGAGGGRRGNGGGA